jgi:hypothetical protein
MFKYKAGSRKLRELKSLRFGQQLPICTLAKNWVTCSSEDNAQLLLSLSSVVTSCLLIRLFSHRAATTSAERRVINRLKYIEVVVVYSKALFLHTPIVTVDQRITFQSDGKDAKQQPPFTRYAVSLHRKFCGQRITISK